LSNCPSIPGRPPLVADLRLHHRDPCDRILAARAISEPAGFYTADAKLSAYSEIVTLLAQARPGSCANRQLTL
jgi:hypothetical protein